MSLPDCVQCGMKNIYPDRENYVCPDCGHEWLMKESDDKADLDGVIKDSNGNVLMDGDSVVLIKDLKVKGTSTTLKVGTKIKGIRLVDGDHEVDCKTSVGKFMLKACFLKKI